MIHFNRFKGYVNIPGNEAADAVAKSGAAGGDAAQDSREAKTTDGWLGASSRGRGLTLEVSPLSGRQLACVNAATAEPHWRAILRHIMIAFEEDRARTASHPQGGRWGRISFGCG